MRDAYHEELDALSERLVEMTRLVRAAMARASTALLDVDLRLAEEVISGDDAVDKLEAAIEQSVPALMARQQPVARDLRAVVTALQMCGNLERMGDLAVHVAMTACRRYPESAVPVELRPMVEEMAQVADRLVAKVGGVIASGDVRVALELDVDDDQMDRLHHRLLAMLLRPEGSCGVKAAIDVTLAGRYYERFADHAVHLAENVVYLVTGQHSGEIIGPTGTAAHTA